MMRTRIEAGLLFCCLLAVAAWTQNTPGSDEGNTIIANGGLLHTLLAARVTGHPYSAVQIHSTRRTLTDGTNISHHGHHEVARDTEGRVHAEVRTGKGEHGQPDPAMVFVVDPLAHTLTTWVIGPNSNRQAWVYPLPQSSHTSQAEPTPPVDSTSSTPPRPVVTTEDLGTDLLQGVPVAVQRTTTVLPVGSSGNDAPITKTDEKWLSADMKLILKEEWTDPRSGVRTVELTHLSLAEPDAALFRPPSGYAVKNAIESLKELEKQLGNN